MSVLLHEHCVTVDEFMAWKDTLVSAVPLPPSASATLIALAAQLLRK